jgi:23S rRNA (adenine1618-N6)-methyltransferase
MPPRLQPAKRRPAPDLKPGLHPRNRHRERYELPALTAACPELEAFLVRTPAGEASIDFANPEAVKTLNRALLKYHYGVAHWELPPGYLCPPIPGRADYLHHLADLLAAGHGGVVPRGGRVRVLDVGVGANCVYPLLGHHEYGWGFLGSEIDPRALACAQGILEANRLLPALQVRLQPHPGQILKGLLQPGEVFDLTLCNPPFHASPAEAREGSERKWRNLGRGAGGAPVLNFGGQGTELWCPGGEAAFVTRMIQESAALGDRCLWFTSLVAKEASLPEVKQALRTAGVVEHRIIAMAQGQKKSRILAWTFQDAGARERWARERWGAPGA